MKLIVALWGKVLKSVALKSNKLSEKNSLHLNGHKGVLEVKIVRSGWLIRRTRSGLTRLRGWLVGCRSNNILITKDPIKVNLVKKGGMISIGKQQKPVLMVN